MRSSREEGEAEDENENKMWELEGETGPAGANNSRVVGSCQQLKRRRSVCKTHADCWRIEKELEINSYSKNKPQLVHQPSNSSVSRKRSSLKLHSGGRGCPCPQGCSSRLSSAYALRPSSQSCCQLYSQDCK